MAYTPKVGDRVVRQFIDRHFHGTVVAAPAGESLHDFLVQRDDTPGEAGLEKLAGWYPAEGECCGGELVTLPPPTKGFAADTTVAQLLFAGIEEPIVLATIADEDRPGVLVLHGERILPRRHLGPDPATVAEGIDRRRLDPKE